MCQGKGSLSHNNREFSAKNIDSSRTANNIVFVKQDFGEAYEQLFGTAVERYNARQKRNDRKINNYFQHLFNREPSKSVITGANKQKSFYEDLVQIGTKDDTGVETPDAEIAVACLRKYMEAFQSRNPNFHVFNAVMHLDEATPHLHIDYIPVGHFDRGLDTRNAMAKALEEMGHGKGANAINRWRLSEWEVLRRICLAHGIEISEPKKSRGYSYTTEEYGKHKDEIRRLEEEKEQAVSDLEIASKKRTKLMEIDNVATGKTVFGGKVTVSQDDWDNVTALAKKEIATQKQTKKLLRERDELQAKYDTVSSELEEYKLREEETRHFSRKKLNSESQRISREEQLTRNLSNALKVIDSHGLREEYERATISKAIKRTDIE